MKYLLFTLAILVCSVSYGQVPITKDRLLILVTGGSTCSLSKDADKHFADPGVRKYMSDNGIQFVKVFGDDMTPEWRSQNKITHYPSLVYYMKQDGELKWAKTYSGPQKSRGVGKLTGVRQILGMKAETYKAPPQVVEQNPMIPGSQPPVQYIQGPPQSIQQWPYSIPSQGIPSS